MRLVREGSQGGLSEMVVRDGYREVWLVVREVCR